MKKRVLAGLLWFYATWYAWSIFASFTGLPDMVGPVIGLAAAILFAVDPLGRIWTGTARDRSRADAAAVAEPA